MKYRTLCFFVCIIASALLFITGLGTIIYIKSTGTASVKAGADSGNGTGKSPVDDIFNAFRQDSKPFNVLILGGDKVNNNSDTMILANFDPATYKINVMSIPRDTKVIIDNQNHKINFAYPLAGINLAAGTVSALLDVNIKYYVYLDISAFRKIVDLLGGVDIYVPIDLDYDAPDQNLHIHLKGDSSTLTVTMRSNMYGSGNPRTIIILKKCSSIMTAAICAA